MGVRMLAVRNRTLVRASPILRIPCLHSQLKHLSLLIMEDDTIQSSSNIAPIALALLGIILGGVGLYFGLSANQRLNPIDASVEASTTYSAKMDQLIQGLDLQIAELAAQVREQSQTVNRLRVYSSQGEQAVKKLAAELNLNREQIVKTAEKLNKLAAAGIRAATVSSLPAAQLSSAAAQSGQVDALAPAPTTVVDVGSTYVIVSGDSFAKIAARMGIPLQAILDANPEADPRRLAIGQTIYIPAQ